MSCIALVVVVTFPPPDSKGRDPGCGRVAPQWPDNARVKICTILQHGVARAAPISAVWVTEDCSLGQRWTTELLGRMVGEFGRLRHQERIRRVLSKGKERKRICGMVCETTAKTTLSRPPVPGPAPAPDPFHLAGSAAPGGG
ncbi:MAG: hypothetical protein Q9190_004852 [Brigantiaea leucoxantha]